MSYASFAKEIVSVCPDAIIAVDRRGIISLFNEAAERLVGWSSEEVLGKMSIAEIYPSLEVARQVKRDLCGPHHGGPGRLIGYETEGRTRSGRRFPVHLSAVVLHENGEATGSVGFFHDLSKRKELEDKLFRQSITDGLTGLFNRRHFYTVLHRELTRSQRYQRPLTLVYIDLDHFKAVNDTLGHQRGDEVLCLASNCAKEVLRAQDYAFRQGGDEFALLLVETSFDNGYHVAERFRQRFNVAWARALAKLANDLEPVTLSLGVAQHQEDEAADRLIARTDMAMYSAKKAGGDRTVCAGGTGALASTVSKARTVCSEQNVARVRPTVV